MSGCCEPGDLDAVFTVSRAEADARRYERHGLSDEGRWILERARPAVTGGGTALEIGGGIGAVQLDLLRAGASGTTNVELSAGYEPAARRLLSTAGLGDRVARLIGDFVTEAERLPIADVVILQRVVCCYPDAEALVGAAAAHARQRLLLTLPADHWWAPVAPALINLWPRLMRSRFRFFVHPTRGVVAAAEAQGLVLRDHVRGLVWQRLLFVR